MEENVALDSTQQKQFVKSVRGIKKLLKKKSKNTQKSIIAKDEVKPAKHENKPLKITKVKKNKKRQLRGLVYISHIPHGFYEPQMTEYFKQFGVVTNVRVIRSKKTGNSKGFAFVEFKEPSVAEIVAETMNNYLMGKRLLKAVYIPPKEQKLNALRRNWNNQHNPASEQRLKIRKAYNATKTDGEELKIAKKLLAGLSKTKEKLSNLGIDYDFFKPVDVPEALSDVADKVDNKKEEKLEAKTKKKTKINPTEVKVENNKKNIKIEPKESNKINSNKQNTLNHPLKSESESNEKFNKKTGKANNKDDKIKKNKIKGEDIKPLQDFIKINNDDDDDDESVSDDENDDFDSDEFEKLMASDDEDQISSDDEDGNSDTDDENDESEEEEEIPKMKPNKKPILKNVPKNTRSNVSKIVVPENVSEGKQLNKRKNVQNAPVAPKKLKFEKQNKKKPLKKIIKKKK